ncbi:DUF5947 family protein [Nocardia pseudobrasiliensis]|uniref:Uncharacterized protein n=1 Tax=Nocardia pseudobrasiliensis TaxID=45979 RepID=A0A370HSV6_9NOCA|nr:DUF5947 family protein [Nocardia pseudobrasiliensis]RDI61597.1 hypothetical protein DFR76_11398 [Nocardia pseudobrasiliensis]
MNPSFGVLRRLATARPAPTGERCEMCADSIARTHRHVVDVEARQLMCVCQGCYLLFTESRAALRYRSVPDRYLSFEQTSIGPGEWDELEIPVGLAFLFRNSALGRIVACYPGPAGATESELPPQRWRELLDRHPELDVLAADVEALLIRMPRGGGAGRVLLVPIDTCYEFVGRMRLLWRGFDGGAEARGCIEDFFAAMVTRAGGGR